MEKNLEVSGKSNGNGGLWIPYEEDSKAGLPWDEVARRIRDEHGIPCNLEREEMYATLVRHKALRMPAGGIKNPKRGSYEWRGFLLSAKQAINSINAAAMHDRMESDGKIPYKIVWHCGMYRLMATNVAALYETDRVRTKLISQLRTSMVRLADITRSRFAKVSLPLRVRQQITEATNMYDKQFHLATESFEMSVRHAINRTEEYKALAGMTE